MRDVPPNVIGLTGIAELLGVSRQRAHLVTQQAWFPQGAPLSEGSRPVMVWDRSEVTRAIEARREAGLPLTTTRPEG